MRDLSLPKHFAGIVYLIAGAFVLAGTWALFHTPGKNGFDSLPLFWLLVLIVAPVVSSTCTLVLWQQRQGFSPWMALLATLFLLPQAYVWFIAVLGVLHYLGWVS